jgi:hypothetical protein
MPYHAVIIGVYGKIDSSLHYSREVNEMKLEQTDIATYLSVIVGSIFLFLSYIMKDIAFLFSGGILVGAGIALILIKIWADNAIKEINEEYLDNIHSRKSTE